jgi:hypothetical protein
VQCGGKLDEKWSLEIYKKFAITTAWYTEDFKFINYEKFQFEVADITPLGHLPYGTLGGSGAVGCSLLSHPDL